LEELICTCWPIIRKKHVRRACVCVCVCVCYGSGVRFPKQTMVVRSVVIVELATIVYKRTEQASIILKKRMGVIW